MSNPEHEQIIRDGYAVAEAMDVPGFVNAFTPDGTFTDEAFGNVFTGSKELAIMLQVFGNAFPDMHRELHRFYSVDDMVIVQDLSARSMLLERDAYDLRGAFAASRPVVGLRAPSRTT
jgi:hypothetical protein